RRGRREEFSRFSWKGEVPDPQDEATFSKSKLNRALAHDGRGLLMSQLYHELIALRRTAPALARRGCETPEVSTEPSGCVLIRRQCGTACANLLLNLGDLNSSTAPKWDGGPWQKVFDSSAARWDGPGEQLPDTIAAHDPATLVVPRRSFAVFILDS